MAERDVQEFGGYVQEVNDIFGDDVLVYTRQGYDRHIIRIDGQLVFSGGTDKMLAYVKGFKDGGVHVAKMVKESIRRKGYVD